MLTTFSARYPDHPQRAEMEETLARALAEQAEIQWRRIPVSIRPLSLQRWGVLIALSRQEPRTALVRLEEWKLLESGAEGVKFARPLLHLYLGQTEQALALLGRESPDGSLPEEDLLRMVILRAEGDTQTAVRIRRKIARRLARRRKSEAASGENPFTVWLAAALNGLEA